LQWAPLISSSSGGLSFGVGFAVCVSVLLEVGCGVFRKQFRLASVEQPRLLLSAAPLPLYKDKMALPLTLTIFKEGLTECFVVE
jgi:hypothetical protein